MTCPTLYRGLFLSSAKDSSCWEQHSVLGRRPGLMTLEQGKCSRLATVAVHQLHIGAEMQLFRMGKRQ